MAGNVWEWTNDWFQHDYYASSPYSNPLGPASGTTKVLRSGSFNNDWDTIRVAYRTQVGCPPDGRAFSIGFRCAGGIPGP